jgi:ABC-2 type transport system ATP-binding protein
MMSSSAEALLAAPSLHAASAGPAPAELRGASVIYDGTTALDAVDLTLEPGRITVLLGPNGAGKTSAIKLLLGLLRPAAGTARVFGLDPRTLAARRHTGVMMQVAKVPETLRVAEHIDTFRSYYPQPLERHALVEAAGLQGLERRLYGTLSGGEKQRVLFALALAGDPELLFLDEPTVGMDVSTRRSFWSRIRALRDHGRAVLLTTHYLEEADALAERIVVLDRGRVVADGPPADVKRVVPDRRIQCRTSLSLDQVRSLAGVNSAHRLDDATVVLAAAAETVVRALLAADPSLAGLEVTGASLEDAFLALTPGHDRASARTGQKGGLPDE